MKKELLISGFVWLTILLAWGCASNRGTVATRSNVGRTNLIPLIMVEGSPFPTNTTIPTNGLPSLVIDTNKLWLDIYQTKTNFTVVGRHLTNGVTYYLVFKHHASDVGWHLWNLVGAAAPSNSVSKVAMYAAGYFDSAFFNIQNTTNGIIP